MRRTHWSTSGRRWASSTTAVRAARSSRGSGTMAFRGAWSLASLCVTLAVISWMVTSRPSIISRGRSRRSRWPRPLGLDDPLAGTSRRRGAPRRRLRGCRRRCGVQSTTPPTVARDPLISRVAAPAARPASSAGAAGYPHRGLRGQERFRISMHAGHGPSAIHAHILSILVIDSSPVFG